jgi:ABC-type taurine transport system ATPase subunit
MPWASVIRNVAFGLELRGMAHSEREAIAERHIARVGLKGFERNIRTNSPVACASASGLPARSRSMPRSC